MKPSRFILGKSLVPSSITDDVFAGILPQGIAYRRSPGFTPPIEPSPILELGGSWNFYRQFWQAHGLDRLGTLVPPELSVQIGGTLTIPLIIENPTGALIDVKFEIHAPEGWKLIDPPSSASIDPQAKYFMRVQAAAPLSKQPGWQQFTVSAESNGKSLGTVPVRVELANWALPQ